jgi:hypothetical protein
VPDVSIYGDSLSEDLLSLTPGRVTVVTNARSGEWEEHLRRRVGAFAESFCFERFNHSDHQPLIERLLRYVPAPSFLKMKPSERIKKLAASKSQLLIALKETTTAQRFQDVITDEFKNLGSADAKYLVVIVGVATLAKVGISPSAAQAAYRQLGCQRDFGEVLRGLTGIVLTSPAGRYVARHELYVRHIVENVCPPETVADTIECMLDNFTQFRHPIYKNVAKFDGVLFRFLLNHNFLKTLARDRRAITVVIDIYKSFEVEFQADGHFWLQFGQFLVEANRLEEAMDKLTKSIQAYPDNEFALHALADVQLRVALRRPSYDSVTRELIGDAVESLMRQDARLDDQSDQYPIVTLAYGHVRALAKHGQMEIAKQLAANYFDRVQNLRRRKQTAQLDKAAEFLLRFATTGQLSKAASSNKNSSRPKRKKKT